MFDDDTTCGSFEGSSIPARWHDYGPDARILRLDARFATFAGGSPGGVSGMSWSSMRRARKCVAALDELLVCVVGLFEVVLRRDRAVVFGE